MYAKKTRNGQHDIYSMGAIDRNSRIVHHAVMNILEPVLMKIFTADTYSCIKLRGIHGAAKKMRSDLPDFDNTRYCLKIDIKKYYPSINHDILKEIIRRKIKAEKY